jgi:hypothetical protein
MTGNKLWYAEETIFQKHLYQQHPDIRPYNDNRLVIYHLVRPEKMKLAWRLRSVVAIHRSLYQMAIEDNPIHSSRFAFWRQKIGDFIAFTSALIWNVCRMFIVRNRDYYPQWQNFVHDRIASDVGRLTSWYEEIRQYRRQARRKRKDMTV